MRIGLITPEPGHPLLAGMAALLAPGHRVEVLDPGAGADAAPPGSPADLYLLKSGTPRALELARELERRGAPVVNSAAATALCQDRTEMAELAVRAGLPFAATRTHEALSAWAAGVSLASPVVVKSRRNRRGDLVARVDTPAELRELARAWPGEPVVVQEFAPNSGWDHKLWAIGDRIFAARRRSELSPQGRGPNLPLARLPSGWADLTLRVGEVFGLDVYGVDIIDVGDGAPLIVDVNAFPGVRGQAGAPEALAALALRRAGSPSVPAPRDGSDT
ncbi:MULTISPECIES: RimK family alpha-L-glutamate ligase [unclassified Streptomyces]|uniref:ATP-grasp domain-containing protein n=1 Tax=unclassified Streptomyces TaxID=2593676 RepID=UPI00225A9294|nr:MULTISPECIES: alpha-L-glutamate ligase [unclassified Streptomyces]MCX4524225.1 alpha-L-glutamate ligase [Streptomyces sp. NBC_01551]MCX4545255.1 alpha-L-glutamate ligase [Streptomyces sp. NBC_01565]